MSPWRTLGLTATPADATLIPVTRAAPPLRPIGVVLHQDGADVFRQQVSVGESTPDEILMAAYQAGNQAAFGALYERYAGPVFGFLVRRLGDRALADDLYQEAFLRLHRARATYDASRPFRAWLFGIVRNLVTDALRTQARGGEAASLDAPAERGHGSSEASGQRADLAAPDPSPERQAAARQMTSVLSDALRALPPDEATVLILARFEGLSYDDIGTILGRSAPATKQLAYRALKRVRATLVAAGHQEEP